ncbi:MAG TPA: NAD(P)-binding domain-containing protein, partial [Flavisolibacter sp.]|nr:NAD(P)-binding domain-containing protein [Flavisolibacter sp.]
MDIVIIGTGNTATILGRKLKKAGHNFVHVFGRNSTEASELAYELDTESTNYWNVVNKNADLYILAVSDIAVEEVFQELRLADKT